MTPVDTTFSYGRPPDESALRALDKARDVYGVRKISFNESMHMIQVEYDASRLTDGDIAALLREAGFDVHTPGEIAVA